MEVGGVRVTEEDKKKKKGRGGKNELENVSNLRLCINSN